MSSKVQGNSNVTFMNIMFKLQNPRSEGGQNETLAWCMGEQLDPPGFLKAEIIYLHAIKLFPSMHTIVSI